jgi:hypothetical protein
MSEIKNYKIDIVKRTNEILVDFYPIFKEDDREVTFLMNCLLGIIIAITENEKDSRNYLRGNIDDDFIKFIPENIGFIIAKNINEDLTNFDLIEINVKVGHKLNLIGRDKFWLLSKIRNCIAHQNIFGINENGQWIGVRLWNMNNSKKDFEIVFTIDELKSYAIELASKFISTNQ